MRVSLSLFSFRLPLLAGVIVLIQACGASQAQQAASLSNQAVMTETSNVQSPTTYPIVVDNALSNCLGVEPVNQVVQGQQVQQILAIDVKQSIGYCGCTSAQVSVYSDLKNISKQADQANPSVGAHQSLAQTPLVIKQSGQYVVQLGSLAQLSEQAEIVLSLRCQGPQ